MPYDEGLAQRIREILSDRADAEEKKMFGGLCFMVNGHMCCGIVGDRLMARVKKENYERYLSEEHASEMDFTGRSMKGMIYVSPDGLESDEELSKWVTRCLDNVISFPPKA